MTTRRHPAVTIHHHPEHGLTHVIPTNGGHDYWVRHADGAFGIRSTDDDDRLTWGYLVGAGELEIIESPSYDPIVLDAMDRERAEDGLSEMEVLEIFNEHDRSDRSDRSDRADRADRSDRRAS